MQLSPADREQVRFVNACLDKLGRAVGQADETLFVLDAYLRHAGHGPT